MSEDKRGDADVNSHKSTVMSMVMVMVMMITSRIILVIYDDYDDYDDDAGSGESEERGRDEGDNRWR